MSKCVLVMDMPSACKDCPLHVSINESICVKTLKDITDKEYFEQRPDWCPLKPMPSKKDDDFYDWGKANQIKGYNACIDELLKGEEG